MTLLATSTPQKRNAVRILFYGQSITEQQWSKAVADDLKARFPHADLDVRNRAIGGFASQLLVRPAEHDVHPFYPDLVVFHVYGAHDTYEQIIKAIRTRTTAEVLMQTDHVAAAGFQETPDEKADKGLWWDWMMNHRLLPEIAKKYGCTLVDVRAPWVAYLKQNNLQPKALLKDGVHLNDHGNWLMAELIKRHLVHRPDLPHDSWEGLTRTYVVGKDVRPVGGKVTLEVEGNRVDVVPAPGGQGTVRVLVDGKRPSEHPGCYAITRPAPHPWSPLTVTRVDHDKPLALEDWTLTITGATPDGKGRTFEVAGGVTGKDGAGDTLTPFASPSGRVRIDPKSFFGSGDVKPGYKITWKVVPLFADEVAVKADADATRENAVTVAQGIENGKHTVELSGPDGAAPAVAAVRVYRPAAR
jgi:lysophospholipase L1-like esterase